MKKWIRKTGICLAILSMGLTACAPAKNTENKSAKKTISEAKKIEKIKCDGQGTDLSGMYKLVSESGTGKCTDNDQAIEIPELEMIFKCMQKDDQFSCIYDKKRSVILKGCINADESFSLHSPTDLGLFESVIRTVGATENEMATMITVDSTGAGTMKYSSVASNHDQTKSCNFEFTIQAEIIEQ